MAEAFLSAIAATVLEQIATVVSEEIRMAYNVRNDIEKLKETMSRIQAVLLDAERQQHENESLRRCMWKLKEIFYDAEDVIDDFKCKSLREQVAHDHNISKKVRALTKVPGRPSSLKLPGKLKDINNRLNELATEWDSFNLQQLKCDPKAVDKNVRHLSFCGSKLLRVPEALKDFKNVRTVLVQEVSEESKRIHESIIDLCVSNFKHLRALRLRCYSPLTTLPNSICSLKHLRDLDLTGCRSMGKLPFSFYKLRCLQKLKISGIPLKYLPDRMESLIELRHLEITIKAKHLKEIREGCWTRLQHLGLIECDNLECLPKGLQYLTSLRRLDLVSCSKLVSLPRSLIFLTRLEDLRVSSCKKINLQMEPTEFDVKRPQLSLKTLSLWDSDELKDFPRLLLQGSSSTLQQIQIGICNNFEVLPTWLRNLTSLRKLEILNCPKLSALPEGMERLTRLRQLTIKQCPNLSIRCRPYVGADWRKIAHVQDRDTPEY
ncbi:hypothetical protein PVK06_018361 [Gossypium arboreum]|uniref:Rx N-terminal domain-containing protein n=1 Tax=Gossypium arboreum TaxID=29729 RepID=A0ABR0Q5Y4_GOSAR|nr:hypothetical protein PVK06_018361 [Gossypium arboreum]